MKIIESVDTRTAREKAIEAKHRTICKEFEELRRNMPGTSTHRLFTALAERHGMTVPGIRNIAIKAGLYRPATIVQDQNTFKP